MHKTAHWLQWAIVGLFGAYLGVVVLQAASGDPANGFHFRDFGNLLCIDDGGRVKPLDSFARGRLMLISARQTFTDEEKRVRPATQWLLDTMLSKLVKGGGPGLRSKVVRIENEEVLGLLHLEPRPGSYRYAPNEFAAHFEDLEKEAKRAANVDAKHRSVYDIKVLEVARHVELLVKVALLADPGVVPTQGDWLALRDVLANGNAGKQPDPVSMHYLGILTSYAKQDVEGFNKSVDEGRVEFEKRLPGAMKAANLEVFFNEFAPFYHCALLYAFIFVLACVSWLGWFPTLNRGAFWAMLLVALVHTWALVARIYIQGRPPVTNLYSSAVFIGWGCVVTCLCFEYFFRNSIAIAVGCVTGALTLLVAHFLSLESADTMEMMQAVLDTNFWLATHVTCVTLGYTATFVAGFLGIAYISAMASSTVLHVIARRSEGVRRFLETPESRQGARGFFTHFFETEAGPVIGKMLYGIVCFGMFLSFTGTVLGGLWADYSWGRFWGWDPKENGALLIVIWCALILHARWGGMVKHRGIAVLAVLGNIVTSWSWFGTNFLGVGLHSYGFMAGAMWWLLVFDLIMLTIATIGMLPLKSWATLPPREPTSTDQGRSDRLLHTSQPVASAAP